MIEYIFNVGMSRIESAGHMWHWLKWRRVVVSADASSLLRNSIFILLSMVSLGASAQPGFVDRHLMEPGVYVVLRNGDTIFLECTPPSGTSARAFFEKYLADGDLWKMYAGKGAVALHFSKLRPEAKRNALLVLFPLDYVDESGWWHIVRFDAPACGETMSALAEWLTGSSDKAGQIAACRENRAVKGALKRGDKILVPQPLLLPVMRALKAPPPPPVIDMPQTAEKRDSQPEEATDPGSEATPGIAFPFVNGNAEGLLKHQGDIRNGQAVYYLQAGESLYSAVVVRFTDYRENQDILDACEVIAQRSGIQDVHRIKAGQKIIIPVEMLSDRFKPAGSEERRDYESIRAEEQRLTRERVHSKDLEGVVVILDSGHGGRDHGAAVESLGLYEDEINYDIVCRIKRILETQTRAKVYVTTSDPRQGYEPSDATRFRHDTVEVLKTTPQYANDNCDISVILRYYLANDIYFRERDNGTDERKILYTSIHCDWLFNETLRGAMVYVPGAKYRNDPSVSTAKKYSRYEEVRRHPTPTTTYENRKRDEALSRVFATTLLHTMRTNDPPLKVHDAGDPIRNVIRQSKGKVYLPGVLRYNVVPTKVLIEVANMRNPQDQQRLADPKWRQWFAEAYVAALRKHYNQ